MENKEVTFMHKSRTDPETDEAVPEDDSTGGKVRHMEGVGQPAQIGKYLSFA